MGASPLVLSVPGFPRSAEKNTSGEELAKLKAVADKMITPSIRYSQPGLQTHITYLYGMTNATDQKIGRDAIERYEVLRKELDQRIAELNKILGASN